MNTTTTPETTFAAWRRHDAGHPWRKIGEAGSEAEAWALLRRETEFGGDQAVVKSDVDMNTKRKLR